MRGDKLHEISAYFLGKTRKIFCLSQKIGIDISSKLSPYSFICTWHIHGMVLRKNVTGKKSHRKKSQEKQVTWHIHEPGSICFFIAGSRTTVLDLITAHTPISAQSSNLVVFRLQPVYFLSTFFIKAYVVGTHLNCIDLSMQLK